MPVTTEELRAALEGALGRPVEALERRPFAYRTSFALEELDVRLDGGASLSLLLKDVSREALSEAGRGAKPDFLYDPRREIETYRRILAPSGLGTAACYGAVADGERFWLLLEKVAGIELWQVGELSTWEEVARWLARLHARCREARTPHLLRYDASFYGAWPARARAFRGSEALEAVLAAYEPVVEELLALPQGFVHGEFYASNVLVGADGGGRRVCPVDWEMAAVAPGLVDLAALTTGKWDEEARTAMALAYYEEAGGEGSGTGREEFLRSLECCRLHVAVQWLGWSPDWSPPAEHAQDWLAEALRAAESVAP